MFSYLPFLISANSFGIIAVLIFAGSGLILSIPIFASRGGAQLAWAGMVGFLLTVEAAVFVTLVVLVSNGTIWQTKV
ncbi:MAG: hypothetical protein ABI782_11005 [Anaerolineaceae bacterium]